MMRDVLMGLDLGTTFCKCGVYGLNGEKIIETARPIFTDHSKENGAEQQPEDWIRAITEVLREAAGRADNVNILAIGLSAHGPGAVFLGEMGEVLCPTAIWQDNRCADEGHRLFDEIGYGWVGHGMPQTGFAARLRWAMKEWPEINGKIARVKDVKGYILHFLTGENVTEPSSSAGNMVWDRDMLEACGLTERHVDRVQLPASIAGGLLPGIARVTGIPAGTPVVCGLNDGAAAMLGAGAIMNGSGVVSVSTNGIARIVLDKKLSGRFMYENSMFCWPYVDGKFVAGGFTKSAGDTVQWYLDMAYRDCRPEDRLADLNREAEASGMGARGVCFYPWLLGRGSPDATERPEGCFLGMGRHNGRGDCARAIFEGLAFALKDIGNVFRSMGYPWDEVRLTGGGMNSRLWRSIVCDVLDVNGRFTRADSLLGAAMIGGISAGVYRDGAEAIERCVDGSAGTEPRSTAATEYYKEAYDRYTLGKAILAKYAKNDCGRRKQ